MDNNKKIEWINKATDYPNLRYPVINLAIMPAFNYTGQGKVKFETFVSSKDNNRLTLVRDEYLTTTKENIFDIIDKLRSIFNDKCKLTQDKYIFNEEWSIYEPYEYNKIKNEN